MKKTIISTTLALTFAASASAINLSDALTSSTGITGESATSIDLSAEEASGGFTAVMTLDTDYLRAWIGEDRTGANGTLATLFSVTAESSTVNRTTLGAMMGWYVQSGYNYNGITGTVSAAGKDTTSSWSNRLTLTGNSGEMYGFHTIDLSGVENAALTLVMNSSIEAYLTLSHSDGTVVTHTGGAANSWGSSLGEWSTANMNTSALTSFYLFEGDKISDTATAVNLNKAAMGLSIPEPATATLSLLALAGLAARRRRK